MSKAVASHRCRRSRSGRRGSWPAPCARVRCRRVELLRAYLERVDRLNPAINAIVVDDRERALKDAKAADRALARGAKVGPLHGVPMTVKESFNIPGQPTTFGSPAFADNIATSDAVAVARLRAAGAVIFGKTNVPLSLADFQSYNDVYGTTNNPWDLARGAGGSSGGSAAALAAGLTGLEFGSDIGGSIRNPAAYNGVYGHKPTYGIVPKRGHTLSELLVGEGPISVVGPLARSADDLALALKVTAGPDLEDGYQPGAARRRRSRSPACASRCGSTSPTSPRSTTASPAPIEDAARALERAGAKVDFDARPAFDVARGQRHVPPAAPGDDDRPRSRTSTRSSRTPTALARRRPQRLRQEPALVHGPPPRRAHRRRGPRPASLGVAGVLPGPRRRCSPRSPLTPPFPHDHSEPLPARTMSVNGTDVPYFGQLFWAGLAISAHLPATAAPVGRTPTACRSGCRSSATPTGTARRSGAPASWPS